MSTARTTPRLLLLLIFVHAIGCVFEDPAGEANDASLPREDGSTLDAAIDAELDAAVETDAAPDAETFDADAGALADADATIDDDRFDGDASEDATVHPDAEPPDSGPVIVCGDGRIEGTEACDDGNLSTGDGCESCAVIAGYVCVRAPSRCVLEAEVAFADTGTTSCSTAAGCGTAAMPCCTITTAIDRDQPIVIVRAGIYMEMGPDINAGREVEIIAEDGAVLEVTAPLEIRQAATATITGLTIRSPGTVVLIREAGTAAFFFDCTIGPSGGIGFDIKNGTTIRLERNLVAQNELGGVKVDTDETPYRLANNVIVQNGAAATEFGGVYLKKSIAGSVLINNTIADNEVGGNPMAEAQAGIRCDIPRPLITNSIIWNNQLRNGAAANVSAMCDVEFTDLGPTETATRTLFNEDPRFFADYRIPAISPCVDRGDPAALIAPAEDIDFDPRPLGLRVDVGADEVF